MALIDIVERFYGRFPKLPTVIPFKKVQELRQLRRTNPALSQTIDSLKSKLMLPPIVSQVALGKSFNESIVDFARTATDEHERVIARSFFQALTLEDDHKDIGSIAFGVLLAKIGLYDSAHHYFNDAKPGMAEKYAAYEYFDSACFIDSAEGFKALEKYIEANRSELSATALLSLMKLLAKFRRVEALAKETQLLIATKPNLSAEDARQLAWFQAHLNHTDEVTETAPGVINIAVMDYKMLDRSRSSGNRGDYVQTLAALSNLLRFKNVEYVGDSKLSVYLNDLKKQVHSNRQIDGPKIRVQPVPLDRDYSSGRNYPENTWLISNGWFMHRIFGGPVDFPYPKNVLPLMISFHIQDPDVLTEETVAELKRIEPIGCRDWTTVYRLRDFGIKCFFSGCVTTTVGQILPPATNTSAKKLALVETPLNRSKYGGWQIDNFIQVGEQVRDFDLVQGIEDARGMLTGYVDYQVVATSRLHCYLPARSMGLKVDFTPKNFSDVRFEGLLNLDEAAFGKMRKGIEDKLEITLAAIFAGKTEAEVRKLWAEICADEVAEAEKYATTFSKSTKSEIDVPSAVEALEKSKTPVNHKTRTSAVVETAFALDQNLEKMFPVVMQSLVDHTKREINAHVMTRGLGEEFRTRMGKLFPEVNFFFYSFDSVDYGKAVHLLSHISVSTMDRLFLPEILKHLKKVLYLDIDILIQGDVGELYDLELGSNVFAGKRTRLKSWANMIRPITRATLHFPPAKAWDIRKRLHDEADLTSRTFNAGILVINLEVMRNENFTTEHLYLVEQCRMNDQDVFNIYSKDRVVQIGSEWNHVPAQDFNTEPKIIHWAGPAKPWKPEYVLLKERFLATEAKVQARL
jgi:lipopolysaccharide biosynthesis glycosyltransferase